MFYMEATKRPHRETSHKRMDWRILKSLGDFKMNACQIYDAIFDEANEEHVRLTTEYVEAYAANAMDNPISTEVAQKIIDCHLALVEANSEGQWTHNYHTCVQFVLEEIEV